jgi:NAD-dependent deacetylase
VPTFRGNGGLWKQFRPEDLATHEAFTRDPTLVWQWYDWRRQRIAAVSPNAGHFALADLEHRIPEFTLITQNVDDLHERAGSQKILRLHGDIFRVRCLDCGQESVDKRVPLPEIPPRCECGGLLRPGVVWFGERLPHDVFSEAERAAREAELLLVIGTSAAVYPAAGLAGLARRVVEINTAETPLSSLVDRSLRGASGELLPQLLA